jgi:UDP-glucuronate 4-epimerase
MLNDLISALEERLRRKARVKRLPLQPGDVARTWADVSKARRELDWAPVTGFASGMDAFAAWFSEERARDLREAG